MALDKLGICIEALAELPEPAIESFEDGSVAAEWCARRYPPALAYMLELHDWKFPITRAPLAEIENDRPGEWQYAYALPTDIGSELRVLPTYDGGAGWDSINLLAGQRLASSVGFPSHHNRYAFLVSGSTIYSNVYQAVLEFIPETASESVFPMLFVNALSLELASRLAMPILKGDKGSKRQRELRVMAEAARDRAIADSFNRDPSESRYDNFIPETQLAREGWSSGWGFPFGYLP